PRRRQRARPERGRQPRGRHPGAVRRLVPADGLFARIRRAEDGRGPRRRGRVHRPAPPRADPPAPARRRRRRRRGRRRPPAAARGLAPDQAAVVCGGFHLFLDRDDDAPPPEPPAGTVYTTVVPYSYFRVSEMAGYGAGNRAPQFYQTCYDLTAAGRAADVALEHAIAVLRRMRKGGDPLSTADAIAVTHH